MSQAPLSPQNFFDNVGGGGGGAPTGKLKDLNDFVYGEIVDQSMLPATDFSTKKQKYDRQGNPIEQLAVIVQTEQRNWEGVGRVPLVDKDNPQSGPRPAEEDDGRRAIYIEPWTNIHAAVSDAVLATTGERGPLLNGGKLGVKIVELRDTGKGNPLKVHQAVYEAPAAKSPQQDFFSTPAAQQQAPAQGAPAPVSQNPYENQAAVQAQQAPAPAPAAQQDPWGTPASATPGQPPF